MSLFDKFKTANVNRRLKELSRSAQHWFRSKTIGARQVNRAQLLRDPKLRQTSRVMPGKMYTFWYDPKWKEKLPYYDRFPMIILVDAAQGGFYGINLHYLPPLLRARFLDALMSTMNDTTLTEKSRLRISYNILKSVNKFKEFQPCFKHYLSKHVASRIAEIPADEWETAIFLPTEKFEKASKRSVWNRSKDIINS